MFNIVVTSNPTAWESHQLMRFELSRFGEYSGSEVGGISPKSPASLKALEEVPTLLLYEQSVDGPAANAVRFGYLRDISVVGTDITFRFDHQGHFLRNVFEEFSDRLGVNRFEHNRTHWAIKDGDVPVDLFDKMIPLPFGIRITEVTRRGIIDALLLRPQSFHGKMEYTDFLRRVWNLSSLPSTDPRFENAESDIWQHTVNNADWTEEYLLLDYLNLKECGDKTFLKFLETAVHPLVGDTIEVEARVVEINNLLRHNGFKLVKVSEMSSRPIFRAKSIDTVENKPSHTFEIVLSFAGEDRGYVEQVAAFLKAKRVEVFYDRYEEATLWGKDLAEHLDAVYRKDARYCVMFLSTHYAAKIWTNHERKSALARAVEERQEYILPARFDSTEVPGIRPTLGYVDLACKTPEQLGALILEKLGRATE
jgi:AbiJ N-terminal domain 3/TIR domain